MTKYDEVNGGFKIETPEKRDAAADALLRAQALELERCDGIYPPEPQRNIGETDRAYQNRLRAEVEALKVKLGLSTNEIPVAQAVLYR